jgi:hypothetical protein
MTRLSYSEELYQLLHRVHGGLVVMHFSTDPTPGWSWVDSHMSEKFQELCACSFHARLIDLGMHQPWGSPAFLSPSGMERLEELHRRHICELKRCGGMSEDEGRTWFVPYLEPSEPVTEDDEFNETLRVAPVDTTSSEEHAVADDSIPREAVELAARALVESNTLTYKTWDEMNEGQRRLWRQRAEVVLNAGAPLSAAEKDVEIARLRAQVQVLQAEVNRLTRLHDERDAIERNRLRAQS